MNPRVLIPRHDRQRGRGPVADVRIPQGHGLSRVDCGGRRSAFTLIEILLVMGLLVLLVAMSMPALEGQIRGAEMPDSALRVRSMLFMARSEAVMEHRRYRVRFEPETQQPIIEREEDPIHAPGIFTKVTLPWARDAILLGDVQVHEVRLGRPVWTLPLASTEDADQIVDDTQEAQEEEKEREENQAVAIRDVLNTSEEEDENRPSIVFEPDGSTEWALYVLARVDPEEELEEETSQTWVLLDGRTGLASCREKVTEDQLSDSDFYVDRDKLEPMHNVFGTDPGLNAGGGLGGGLGGLFGSLGGGAAMGGKAGGGGGGAGQGGRPGAGGQSGSSGIDGLMDQGGGLGVDALSAEGGSGRRGGGRRGDEGNIGSGSRPTVGRATGGLEQSRPGQSRKSAADQLDDKLDEGDDLSEEERDAIRESFQALN